MLHRNRECPGSVLGPTTKATGAASQGCRICLPEAISTRQVDHVKLLVSSLLLVAMSGAPSSVLYPSFHGNSFMLFRSNSSFLDVFGPFSLPSFSQKVSVFGIWQDFQNPPTRGGLKTACDSCMGPELQDTEYNRTTYFISLHLTVFIWMQFQLTDILQCYCDLARLAQVRPQDWR